MEEKKKNGKAIYWVSGIAVSVVLLAISAINSNANQGSGNNNSPSSNTETSTAGNLEPQKPYTSFGDGTYIVGTDVLPGTYRSSGGNDCYWERLSGFSGSESDIITNGSNSIITIKNTDKGFDTNGCGVWSLINNALNTKTSNTSKNTATQQPQPTSVKSVTQQSTQPANTQAPNVTTQATWHTVYTYANSVTIHTPTFSLQGQRQKISYTCSITDSSTPDNGFNGIIHPVTGYNDDTFAEMVTCPTNNTTYEYSLSPGQYYLDLSSVNASYSVTVEDYY